MTDIIVSGAGVKEKGIKNRRSKQKEEQSKKRNRWNSKWPEEKEGKVKSWAYMLVFKKKLEGRQQW